jgi:hypothetical protein
VGARGLRRRHGCAARGRAGAALLVGFGIAG